MIRSDFHLHTVFCDGRNTPLEMAESLEQLRWLQAGYRIKVGVSQIETIGIDTPEDLERAEAFLARKGKSE